MNYLSKLMNLRAKKDKLWSEIVEEVKQCHRRFYKDHIKAFKILDAMIIVMIISNLAALAITNMLVMKENQELIDIGDSEPIVFKEVNPAQSKLNGFEQHPESASFIAMLVKQFFLWLLMISAYVYYRYKSYTINHLIGLSIGVSVYCLLFLADFFNNFGFLVGRFFFGG